MSVNTPFLSANGWLGLIAEAVRGTTPGTGSPFFIPTIEPAITPNLTWLNDAALRGSPVENYDQVPATRSDDVDFKCYMYGDTFPALLIDVLGGNDTVTGSGAPYLHSGGLYNNSANGSQPLSRSICLFDAANAIVVTGCQGDQMDLTFGASAAVEATMKYKGNPYSEPTNAPAAPFTSPSFSSVVLAPAWDTTVSIGGSQYFTVEDGSLTIMRKATPIFTEGQQGPNPVFAGTCEVSGKLTFIVDSNSDPFSTGATPTALNRHQQSNVLVFTDPNSATPSVLTLTMSKAQFKAPKRTMSKAYIQIETEFTAVANSTDAISGYAPIAWTMSNAVSAAYQTGH
jgi:hypothetical protein